MTYLTLIIFLFLISSLFLFLIHPLSLGLTLILQTLLISLIVGIQSKTFWFSYILFLIFIGGLLILFIYMTSIASNEMFFLNKKMFFMINFLMLILFFLFFLDKNMLMNYFKNEENLSFTCQNYMMMENILMLNKMFNFPTNFITISLMIYLFLTLIAIVKITDITKGPLRPKF